MKIDSIINRYIFKEMIPPFFLNILFFSFIFMMTQLLEITNLIVNSHIDISAVILMIIYSMPYFLVFIIPMSVMMSVLLCFLRLSGDNEVVALRAGGYSNLQMLPPVFVFAFIGYILTSVMIIKGLPWGESSFKNIIVKMAESNLNIGLKEGNFNENFKDLMLYVKKIDSKTKMLIDIFIEDKRTENMVSTVVAKKGIILNDIQSKTFFLKLYDGTINQVSVKDKVSHTINFETYDIKLDIEKMVANIKNAKKSEKDMNLSELNEYLAKKNKKDPKYFQIEMEYHRKFSIPFACFVFGFLGVPLGIKGKSAKLSFGLGLGLVCFLFYYLLVSIGRVYGETGAYPPAIAMWVPNIVMAVIGIYLFYKNR